jgi:hypothetical protein
VFKSDWKIAVKSSNGVHAICHKNKPLLAETLNAGKAVAEPPEIGIKELSHSFLE